MHSTGTGGEFGSLIRSTLCADPVAGSTHGYYRYPARFSPQFAQAAIANLTEPGDTVLDPFMGGGTVAVEALATGRRFVGCDLNPLSSFLTRAKTQPLRELDLSAIKEWAGNIQQSINLESASRHIDWLEYQINTPWWIRRAIEFCLDSISTLRTSDQKMFARCALLKTGQWALDCRKNVPKSREFVQMLARNTESMAIGMREYTARVGKLDDFDPSANRKLVVKDSAQLALDKRIPSSWLPPKLILTSPPYIGVHILYHRWQVQGRRETPAPYWIVNSLDGFGASHYTFGDRQRKGMDKYLERLSACYESVSSMMGPESILVQLVAFSDPQRQVRRFLAALAAAGLLETTLPGTSKRPRRNVPNRKWYAQLLGRTPSSKEILLVHIKK